MSFTLWQVSVETCSEVAVTLTSFNFHSKVHLNLVSCSVQTLEILRSSPSPSPPPQPLQGPQHHSHDSETLMSSLGTRSQVSCAMLLPLRRMRKRCQSLFLLSFLDTISQQSTTLMTFENKNAQPSIFSSSHLKCL